MAHIQHYSRHKLHYSMYFKVGQAKYFFGIVLYTILLIISIYYIVETYTTAM